MSPKFQRLHRSFHWLKPKVVVVLCSRMCGNGSDRAQIANAIGRSSMSSKTTALPIDRSAEVVTPPENAKTAIPAANPAVTPEMLSSTTAQRSGGVPIASAACKKTSGAGFPLVTSSTLKISTSESSQESGQTQGEPDPFVASTRGHAVRYAYLVERFHDAGYGCKFALEHFSIVDLEFSVPIHSPTQLAFDLLMHVGGRSADKSLDDLGFSEWPAEGRDDLRLGAHHEPLTVDEDPVAVEDHKVERTHGRETRWRRRRVHAHDCLTPGSLEASNVLSPPFEFTPLGAGSTRPK